MIPQASADQYRKQQTVAGTTASSVAKLWRRLGTEFSAEWVRVSPIVLSVVRAGRDASVRVAVPYTDSVLSETGQTAPGVGALVPARFTRDAPDGRPMSSLLDEAVVLSKSAIAGGSTVPEALAQGGTWLTGTVLTVLADTRRQVYHADIIQRPDLGGYARMLNPPSCARCTILAGKWFAWNKGFLRHPRCDCIHIPSSEAIADDFTTDPTEYFGSLSKADQDRIFTKTGARAIRDGADVSRVVNIDQRGLGTAKGKRRFGTPSRMTVDDIYRTAGTRANAIRMLQAEGYVNYQTGRLNPSL
jgi:hypothetical protein